MAHMLQTKKMRRKQKRFDANKNERCKQKKNAADKKRNRCKQKHKLQEQKEEQLL